VGVSEDVIKKGLKSIDIIKPIAEIISGKGGGPPHLATAGGKDASQLPNALTRAKELVSEKLRS
jgi:alanyl-tRNA synthetase